VLTAEITAKPAEPAEPPPYDHAEHS
jgi:hypothetical protein